MKRLLRPNLLRPALLVVAIAWTSSARAEIVESFLSPASTGDNATLGVCKQLTVRLFGGGSTTVAGNGHAAISTPAATDAAFLASSSPLPQTAYKVRVTVSKINFPQNPPGGPENGVTLLAIVNTQPLPANEIWWNSYRMLSVEVDATSDSTNPHPVYVNYWDASSIYTWNGTQWGVGDPNWLPVITYDPLLSYTVEIEKANNWYTIRVSQGATLLTQATVPVPNVRPASTEYLVVGDRLTSDFKGTMQITSVAMPEPAGCSTAGDGIKLDGGPAKDGGGLDAIGKDLAPGSDAIAGDGHKGDGLKGDGLKGDGLKGDGLVGDAGKTDAGKPDAGPPDGSGLDLAKKDSGVTGDRPASWDLASPDRGADQGTGANPNGNSGCDCRLATTETRGTSPLLLLALFALALFTRRRSAP
jgi:hypothetical protein